MEVKFLACMNSSIVEKNLSVKALWGKVFVGKVNRRRKIFRMGKRVGG